MDDIRMCRCSPHALGEVSTCVAPLRHGRIGVLCVVSLSFLQFCFLARFYTGEKSFCQHSLVVAGLTEGVVTLLTGDYQAIHVPAALLPGKNIQEQQPAK